MRSVVLWDAEWCCGALGGARGRYVLLGGSVICGAQCGAEGRCVMLWDAEWCSVTFGGASCGWVALLDAEWRWVVLGDNWWRWGYAEWRYMRL